MATLEQKYYVLKRYVDSIIDTLVKAGVTDSDLTHLAENSAWIALKEKGVDQATFDEVMKEMIGESTSELEVKQRDQENAAKQGYPNA